MRPSAGVAAVLLGLGVVLGLGGCSSAPSAAVQRQWVAANGRAYRAAAASITNQARTILGPSQLEDGSTLVEWCAGQQRRAVAALVALDPDPPVPSVAAARHRMNPLPMLRACAAANLGDARQLAHQQIDASSALTAALTATT